MDSLQDTFVFYTLLSFLLAILIYFLVHADGGKNRKLPPGPIGLPLIGHLHLLASKPHISTQYLASQYGNVFRIRLGSWPAIVVTGREAVTEALVQKSEDFAGRPAFLSSKMICDGKSLSFSPEYDERWKLHNKIVENVLHRFVDNNPIEEMIRDEASIVVKEMSDNTEGHFDPSDTIIRGVGSIIFQVLYGRDKNPREDERFGKIGSNNRRFNQIVKTGNIVDAMPWLRYFLTSSVQNFKMFLANANLSRQAKIDEHKTTFDSEHLRDVTDGLLKAVLTNAEEMVRVGLTEKEVMYTVSDLFGAGLGTVTTTLEWALLYMAKYPAIQNKVYAEIIESIGITRLPSLNDRCSVPYTEATILEIMRMSSVLPMSIPLATTRDTTLSGYDIPKGTVVLVNLYSLAYCTKTWRDPEIFRPERFLDEGKIDENKANLISPFSAGTRQCPGRHLARMELFIFFASIIQRCQIIEPSVGILKMDGVFGLTFDPQPYKIRCVPR